MLNRVAITDALRFWEIGRIGYNLALAGLAAIVIGVTGVQWRDWIAHGPLLVVCAVVANILYCAAYPIDLFVQASDFGAAWRRWRWALWLTGTLFAAMLALLTLAALVLGAFTD